MTLTAIILAIWISVEGNMPPTAYKTASRSSVEGKMPPTDINPLVNQKKPRNLGLFLYLHSAKSEEVANSLTKAPLSFSKSRKLEQIGKFGNHNISFIKLIGAAKIRIAAANNKQMIFFARFNIGGTIANHPSIF
jgi:hypothetical protein